MSYQGWFALGDAELANVSRVTQLSRTLHIGTIRTPKSEVDWIDEAIDPEGGEGAYGMVENAPWYDANVDASAEFAGFYVLEVAGLDDSSLEATTNDYVSDGGSVGKARNTPLTLVWRGVLVASTDRGLNYGKRWLNHLLKDPENTSGCVGPALSYFAHVKENADTPPVVHRNKVRLTRGLSVTRRKVTRTSAMATVTFTMVAADPYEYGEVQEQVDNLGADPFDVTGPGVDGDNYNRIITEVGCPAADYTPVYDPDYPALVEPPTAPSILPQGWRVAPGWAFRRDWVAITPIHPEDQSLVPVIRLRTTTEARSIRVTISAYDTDELPDYSGRMCGYLWCGIVSYLPANADFVIDGENHLAYVEDDNGQTRLAGSLLFSNEGGPVVWNSINGLDNQEGKGFVLTLDAFESELDAGGEGMLGYEGHGEIRASFSFVPKSD